LIADDTTSSASTVTPEALRILKQKPLSVAPGVVDAASDHNPLEIRAGRRSLYRNLARQVLVPRTPSKRSQVRTWMEQNSNARVSRSVVFLSGDLAQTRPEPAPAREPCRARRHYEPPRATAAKATCRTGRCAAGIGSGPAWSFIDVSATQPGHRFRLGRCK
jgi:hypothetical protein